jgi:pSer/pThr/pTyr-binding forkhead associated (FHA) protein
VEQDGGGGLCARRYLRDAAHPAPAAEDVVPALELRVARGIGEGTVRALPRPGTSEAALVVGRDPDCDVVLMDPRVSRRHVRIAAGMRATDFEDLNSSNGTFVNGRRRASGELRPGDRLEIGDTVFAVMPAGSQG